MEPQNGGILPILNITVITPNTNWIEIIAIKIFFARDKVVEMVFLENR